MNVVAAISKLLPPSLVCPGVDSIVAAVIKPVALQDAERALSERAALEASLTRRLEEIAERLSYRSPKILFENEQRKLEAERAAIGDQIAGLRNEANDLRRQVAALMPAHARSVAAALNPFRRSAAEQLLDAVGLAEQALADIDQSNKALNSVGMTPPAAFALPYAAALRALADKVASEKVDQ